MGRGWEDGEGTGGETGEERVCVGGEGVAKVRAGICLSISVCVCEVFVCICMRARACVYE